MGVIGVFAFLVRVWRNVVLYLSPDHPPLQNRFNNFRAGRRGGGGGQGSEASVYCSILYFFYFCVRNGKQADQIMNCVKRGFFKEKKKSSSHQAFGRWGRVEGGALGGVYIIITVTLSNATYSRIRLIPTCWRFKKIFRLIRYLTESNYAESFRLKRDLLFLFCLFVCLFVLVQLCFRN